MDASTFLTVPFPNVFGYFIDRFLNGKPQKADTIWLIALSELVVMTIMSFLPACIYGSIQVVSKDPRVTKVELLCLLSVLFFTRWSIQLLPYRPCIGFRWSSFLTGLLSSSISLLESWFSHHSVLVIYMGNRVVTPTIEISFNDVQAEISQPIRSHLVKSSSH